MGPDSERLVRIEEGMKAVNEKLDQIPVLVRRQDRDHESIVILKRDRWWLFTLGSVALTLAVVAIGIHFDVKI